MKVTIVRDVLSTENNGTTIAAMNLIPTISDPPRCATKAYALDENNLFPYRSSDCRQRKSTGGLTTRKKKRSAAAEGNR